MRCPDCGAHNPADAAWCGQCLRVLDAAGSELDTSASTSAGSGETAAGDDAGEHAEAAAMSPSEIGASAVPGAVDRVADAAGEHDGTSPAEGASEPSIVPATVAGAPDLRVAGDEVEWRCMTCGGWNALALGACAACGALRVGTESVVTRPTRTVGPGPALAASALLPGAGHLVIGSTGAGVARALVTVVWMIGGVPWALGGTAGARAAGTVLLLGVIVLWVASLADVWALVADRHEPFGTRGLLWLVVGVTVALVGSLVTATVGAVGP